MNWIITLISIFCIIFLVTFAVVAYNHLTDNSSENNIASIYMENTRPNKKTVLAILIFCLLIYPSLIIAVKTFELHGLGYTNIDMTAGPLLMANAISTGFMLICAYVVWVQNKEEVGAERDSLVYTIILTMFILTITLLIYFTLTST